MLRIAKTFLFRFISMLIFTSFSSNSIYAQTFTKQQQDSAFLVHRGQERIRKIKKSLAILFKEYTDNAISVFGSLDFSKQNINDKAITAPLNYLYNNVNNNSYRSGFSGGFRLDGVYQQKKFYSLSFAINRIIVGNHYEQKYSLSPFIEDFTHFKADDAFTTISTALHAKVLLPINGMNKYKFYAVVGPSMDYIISNISNENLINKAGRRAIFNGDIGAEFDNKGYYVLFVHYKIGQNSTSTSVPIQLNSFEMGMSLKTKDLF